ncbi:MAG: Transketolase [Chlamydiae bacterium]|nr:Transketolase [Chlamydiota bacterium]
MDPKKKEVLHSIANTVRGLSIDAVEKANSGHPGLPMGCAELGAYLWAEQLRYNPKNWQWHNRDRFVLSAGHGSMWLYSLLHLSGYKLSLEDLKNFRQLHSKTPGHPEYRDTEGVETTTGPLGQGIANTVGMALGQKIMQTQFNTDKHMLFDSKVFCLAGDGCIMEGVSSEASSFAGHLELDNLVLIYDANKISLDGPLPDSCTEDVIGRYRAYGFETYEMDGYDFEEMDGIFQQIRKKQIKPVFIKMHTVIGKGSPNKQGTHKVHGSPLGKEELALTKKELGIPDTPFFIPQEVKDFFASKQKECAQLEETWQQEFDMWANENPKFKMQFDTMEKHHVPKEIEKAIEAQEMKPEMATRSSSGEVLQVLGELPFIYGGSADLSSSDKTFMKAFDFIRPRDFAGKNIKFGVREFAMAAISSGLALTNMMVPFCGTFFTFSDYMRNAIRLASLMKLKVIYQFTHDSIFLGEDGPTHQSIEHLMSLRTIPNLHVMRPCDHNEVKAAWLTALDYQGPTALVLSRQNLPLLEETKLPYKEGVGKGAYILKKEKSKPDYTLIATGSEVMLALNVAKALEEKGKDVRIVSMPCFKLFDAQEKAYKEKVLGNGGTMVSIEAGCDLGWYKYIGKDGIAISINTFGLSAPAEELAKEYGFTVEQICKKIL